MNIYITLYDVNNVIFYNYVINAVCHLKIVSQMGLSGYFLHATHGFYVILSFYTLCFYRMVLAQIQ